MFVSLLSNKSSRSFSNELLVNNRLFTKLALLYHTLKYLKFSQFLYQIKYKVFGFRKVSSISLTGQYIKNLSTYDDRLKYQQIDLEQKMITLQNEVVSFDVENVDWHPPNTKRLWRYSLHYFDFLRQEDLTNEIKGRIIDFWIAKNPQGTETAWEPYTLSLRVVNWIVWFSKNSDTNIQWIENLYMQCRWLRSNLELHILANHYFENLRAIFFASIYFSELQGVKGREVNDWRVFSIRQLCGQLDEQFLADGSHYERSPQYHCIMIKGCIEILWLIKKNNIDVGDELGRKLEKVINGGLSLLDDILRPDGKIPLFNDSSFDATPDIESLFGAGIELDIFKKKSDSIKDINLVEKHDSGYYGAKTSQDWILIDCGDIGPSYQPGHTHCDFLSYQLVVNGLDVVVDTGVFEYAPGEARSYARSTAAHNTLMINNSEQSELWDEFRVGRRAKKQYARATLAGDEFFFKGEYLGFPKLKGIRHEREIKAIFQEGHIRTLKVSDLVIAKQKLLDIEICNHIHFHPLIVISKQATNKYLLLYEGALVGSIAFDKNIQTALMTRPYYPEFGKEEVKTVITLKIDSDRMSYNFQFNDNFTS